MNPRDKWLLAGSLLALALSRPAAAAAHSFPVAEVPQAGQSVTVAPAEVSIKFDAPIEKLFARLQVTDADGRNIATDAARVGDDGYTLSVKVPALEPGEYLVKWSAVCIDAHHSEGSYTFTVTGGSR